MKKVFLLIACLFFYSCTSSDTEHAVDIVTVETGTRTIQDSVVSVVFERNIYKTIEATVLNLKDQPIFLDFDYTTYTSPKGYSFQVLSGFTTYGKIEDAQRIIVVPPNSKYFAVMMPKELTYFVDKEYVTECIFNKPKKNQECVVTIAYRIGEKTAPINYFKIPLKIIKVMEVI